MTTADGSQGMQRGATSFPPLPLPNFASPATELARLRKENEQLQEVLQRQAEDMISLNAKIDEAKRHTAALWHAVANGHYDSREIAGDIGLGLKEVLFGEEWPPESLVSKRMMSRVLNRKKE